MSPEEIKAVSSRATCLFDQQSVEQVIDRLVTTISDRLSDKNPVLLTVMNGGLILAGELATRLHFPLQMDYLHATRYRHRTSGSELEWKHYPELNLRDRSVLIVDDILDEGNTLAAIRSYVYQQEAAEVLSVVLVNKMHGRKAPGVHADYVGLEIEDHYLYGYGMDYRGYLRNVPGIYAVDPGDCD